MEFSGEIVRADGTEESVFISAATWGKVTMLINAKMHTLNEGDSIVLARTK